MSLVVSAHINVFINGKPYGKITDFEWTSIKGTKELRGLDVLHPLEVIPTATGVTGSMTVLRTAIDGGTQGDGMAAPQHLVSREKYFSILLVDRKTGFAIFQADLCTCTGESWSVPAKGMVTGRISFTGIQWTNESALKLV